MKMTVTPLSDYAQTVKEIVILSKMYAHDTEPFDKMQFDEFFNYVCDIPYRKDGQRDEIVQRPKYTFQNNFGDCKKKAILIGAFCHRNGIPVRFCVMSALKNKEPHHIYNEVQTEGGEWITADATYAKNKLGEDHKLMTYKEVWQ